MREIRQTGKFRKDAKRCQKRGLNMGKLYTVIGLLKDDQDLPPRCRPHKLTGNFEGMYECHIEPDGLLVYQLTKTTLTLARTGTHSDLFK